jgi:hypothetical protein
MGSIRNNSVMVLMLVIGVLAGLVLAGHVWSPAVAETTQGSAAATRHTVVVTDGLHLVVTDNLNNTLYFYAIDDGEKPGADLKLRGSVDLTQVGKPVIKPVLLKKN